MAAALWCLTAWSVTAPAGVSEYEVKAALIYKIAKFVRWPDGALASPAGTLRLCLIGSDDFAGSIDALAGQRLQGLLISVERLAPDQPASGCQIVFISRSEGDVLEPLIDELSHAPVLTVSDIDGFAARGGIVGFAMVDSKVSFQINPAASRRAGLEIGAQLLQFATLVTDARSREKP
jgi:hypothetical protein